MANVRPPRTPRTLPSMAMAPRSGQYDSRAGCVKRSPGRRRTPGGKFVKREYADMVRSPFSGLNGDRFGLDRRGEGVGAGVHEAEGLFHGAPRLAPEAGEAEAAGAVDTAVRPPDDQAAAGEEQALQRGGEQGLPGGAVLAEQREPFRLEADVSHLVAEDLIA